MSGRRQRNTSRSGGAPDGGTSAIRHLADHALEAVVTMDRDGIITGWNAQAVALFGWTPAEAIGRPLADTIIPERSRREHTAGLARYMATRISSMLDTPTEVTALHRSGREMQVEVSITALAEGSGTSFVGFIRDLSERRAIEQALRDSEARLRSLVDSLPGIAYVDAPGRTGRYVSSKVEEILGYTADEWLRWPDLWEQILHPDDRQRALAQLAAGEASGGPFSYIYRLMARDGRVVWIRDQATVLREANRQVTVHGVMFDISRERGVEVELELEVAERAAISESLQRLPSGRPAEETAAAICRELLRLPHLDIAAVYEFAHDGTVVPLGLIAPPGVPTFVGRPLPPNRAQYLRESATGPWIDEWHPQAGDDDYRRAWLEAGLTCGAYVPFGTNGVIYGLLSVGTTSSIGTAGVSRWMPSLAEFGAVAAALLVPELNLRREQGGTRAAITRIIDERAFGPVFQPIVRLTDGSVVGYEALTRFAEGVPPDRLFAVAESVGVGEELEAACIAAALREAKQLPSGRWLSLNVSPARLAGGSLSRVLAGAGRRPLVLEITERLPIEDYAAARDALHRLGRGMEVAVDDAGAGFASLRHIIELRPRYTKLDMQLVRGVDGDPARQALIAGMVYFARQSGCLLIAEGIETAAERDTLHRLGVPFGQGFLFGQPAPAKSLPAAIPRPATRAARSRRATA